MEKMINCVSELPASVDSGTLLLWGPAGKSCGVCIQVITIENKEDEKLLTDSHSSLAVLVLGDTNFWAMLTS
jgi:hypothetical protein